MRNLNLWLQYKKKKQQHKEESAKKALRALQKVHKKWPADHHLVVRISDFDVNPFFFDENREAFQFKVAICSADNISYASSRLFIFKKKCTPAEMYKFIQECNPEFPVESTIRGVYFFRPQ